jgi:hypothetical protein
MLSVLVWLMRLKTVDGGHRAIKYTRLGGVKQEIYAEGMVPITNTDSGLTDGLYLRNALTNSLV